jgi:hypothetical protein
MHCTPLLRHSGFDGFGGESPADFPVIRSAALGIRGALCLMLLEEASRVHKQPREKNPQRGCPREQWSLHPRIHGHLLDA